MLYAGRLVRAVTREAVGASAEVPTASLRLLSQVEELGPVGIAASAVAGRCGQPAVASGAWSVCQGGGATRRATRPEARSSLVPFTDEGRWVFEQARRERA